VCFMFCREIFQQRINVVCEDIPVVSTNTVIPRETRELRGLITACWANFVLEKHGYMNADAYGHPHPPLSCKILTFLGIKHLHSTWVSDATILRVG
jgi:hypothetical protein